MHWCCNCGGVQAHVCLAAWVWSWEGGRCLCRLRNLQETSTSKTRKPFLNNLGLPEFALDPPISFFGSGERWRFRVILYIYIIAWHYFIFDAPKDLKNVSVASCHCISVSYCSPWWTPGVQNGLTGNNSGWMEYNTIPLSVKCICFFGCFWVIWRGFKMDPL